ncbi:Serine acetyltransferase [Microcystis aeruginosa NIES-98]|nr:Serine acetyltransferase [Microcystis aeruginosa NIES-98]
MWTKSVTVGAQSLRPLIDWDIIPTQVPKGGSNLKSIFNLIITSYLSTPKPQVIDPLN